LVSGGVAWCVLLGMASRWHVMKMLDAQLAAGLKINAAQFAREHGVSARTVYRHRARILAEGQWRERSRRPHHSPRTTPADLDVWIVKLRTDLGVDNGADFIRDALVDIHALRAPAWGVPSRSTINRVLARHDLLVRNPAKRPRSSYRRFSYARPRDCYQIDATEVKLATGAAVVVFDVIDDCTRTLVACRAAAAETAQAAIAAISRALTEYGAPALVLSDNDTAFTSRLTRPGSLSRFVRTLLDWRVRPINSSPYHPQTCGKVERHHQTLKKWLRTQPSPATIADLQRLLNRYAPTTTTNVATAPFPAGPPHTRHGRPREVWEGPPPCPSKSTPPCTAAKWTPTARSGWATATEPASAAHAPARPSPPSATVTTPPSTAPTASP
jgi:putative transposase